MKKLLIGLTAVALSFNVNAKDDDSERCMTIHKLATSIMSNRQFNADMPKMIEIASGNKAIEEIVKRAYRRPAYSVKENQEREIKRFANDVYMICLGE